jgi:uncharacterized cupredoxin-like copper-binding protein
VALLILFFQFSSNIVDSLTRPSSAVADFALSLTAVIGVILSIPFGIQGFRESRRKTMNPFQASRLTAFALLGFGIFVGGVITANLGSLSQGASTTSLEGPPDVTLTLEEKNTLFVTKELTVRNGNNMLIIIKNSDASVHTFTINEIGVNVENPASRTSLAAFKADKVGTYIFYCAIPGHREAGMEGKITVQG